MTLVNRVRVWSSINKELDKELRALSKNTRIDMSKLLDEAIEDLLEKHKKIFQNYPAKK